MPKENTHIAFADKLLRSLNEGSLKETLKANLKEYYLGAIAPDIFFYHREEAKTDISAQLHGCNGERTNPIILSMLEDTLPGRDFAFAAGYMTHTVLDMTFHPVVYYLSGNYYDDDPKRQELARYRHRYIETTLDIILASPIRSHRVLSSVTIKNLKFNNYLEETFNVTDGEIESTLKRQLSLNGLMTKPLLYPFISIMAGDRGNKSLFYGHIDRHDTRQSLDDEISLRDIFTGEVNRKSYNTLFDMALQRALPRLQAMYGYATGEASREELERAIPGESLDTGSTSKTIREMKYSVLDESEPVEA